ncbi:ABC transporter substrate-binding protein [Spirochaetia bacterium]|nr:ABC transporter substrate-binding protein [Spirochaetia bacterium]
MKKRFIPFVCVLLLGLAALFIAGCKPKEQAAGPVDPNAPVQLLVWCWDPNFNVFAMREAEKVYKKDHPNVSLDVQDITAIEEKLITALSANETSALPDIILQQDNSIQKFVTNFPKAYLPVNGKVDLSKFAQFKLDVGNVNGQNYGVPFDNGATAYFLRSDFIEQAGLKVSDFNDITWADFVRLGKTVKAKTGKALLSYVAGGGDIIQLQLQGSGSWPFDAQGKPYIKTNPVVKEIINTYKELITSGVLLEVPDWNSYIAGLNNGTVVGTIQGCWIIGSITPATDQAGKWSMVNTPRFGNIQGASNYSSQGGSGWMVMAHTKKADVAFDFLDKTFAGSVEFYETILPSAGAISTWLPAADSPIYSQPQSFFGGQKIYEELMDFASKVPRVKYGVYNYEGRDAIGHALQAVLAGTNIDDAISAAQQEVEFLMNQ